MKRKSLIQVVFSLILAMSLVITTITISPQVASAENNTSNTVLEALEKGIEFQEQGDLDNAETSYQEVIDLILANGEVELLIAAKQRLATIKESQGKKEANQLRIEADNAIKLLGIEPGQQCGRCQGINGNFNCAEKTNIGNSTICFQCASAICGNECQEELKTNKN